MNQDACAGTGDRTNLMSVTKWRLCPARSDEFGACATRRKPLPFLFMRFTIQASAASRELRGFVLEILSTLVSCADGMS